MADEQELVLLRRQVRELAEELDEYKRGYRPGSSEEAEVKARITAEALNIPGTAMARLWAARAINHLIFLPGVVVRPERLLRHIAVNSTEGGSHTNTVKVAIYYARKYLEPYELRDGLRTMHGVGYYMTPANCTAIRALIREAGKPVD